MTYNWPGLPGCTAQILNLIWLRDWTMECRRLQSEALGRESMSEMKARWEREAHEILSPA